MRYLIYKIIVVENQINVQTINNKEVKNLQGKNNESVSKLMLM